MDIQKHFSHTYFCSFILVLNIFSILLLSYTCRCDTRTFIKYRLTHVSTELDCRLTGEDRLVFASDLLLHAFGQSLEHHLQQVAGGQRDRGGPRSHDPTELLHPQLIDDGHGLGKTTSQASAGRRAFRRSPISVSTEEDSSLGVV